MPVDTASVGFETSKAVDEFRNYEDSARQSTVVNHYKLMRQNQTMEFVNKMEKKYDFNNPRAVMTIREAFAKLDNYVDSSDPDLSLPNIVHMLQTAERIRRDGKPDWFQLVGLLHDVGKIMFLWGTEEDGQIGTAAGPQWALGGDTWVVGCRIPDCTVFPEFNTLNADMQHPVYSTELGIYEAGCGMENLHYAYGHDEYLYQLLIANGAKIPKEGLAMVRYHSCYPWHTGGAYRQFMKEGDEQLIQAVLDFNKYDLYTKDQSGIDVSVEDVWPHYEAIIDKYLPSRDLKW